MRGRLGGFFGDRAGIRFGLRGRVLFLGGVLLMEGLALMFFSRMDALLLAIPAMLVFSVFVQMSEGATFSVVPFINGKAPGTVAGIVGAGGNAGAVAAGFLFRVECVAVQDAFLYMGVAGVAVVAASSLVLVVRFAPRVEVLERRRLREVLAGATPSAGVLRLGDRDAAAEGSAGGS